MVTTEIIEFWYFYRMTPLLLSDPITSDNYPTLTPDYFEFKYMQTYLQLL